MLSSTKLLHRYLAEVKYVRYCESLHTQPLNLIRRIHNEAEDVLKKENKVIDWYVDLLSNLTTSNGICEMYKGKERMLEFNNTTNMLQPKKNVLRFC